MSTPVVAVNGVCAGGGLHFVADADVVVLSSAATVVDPHVSLGQVRAYETIALCRKSPIEAILRIGTRRAPTSASRRRGPCSSVSPPRSSTSERLRDEAQALAERIASRPTALLRAAKPRPVAPARGGLSG